MLSNFSIKVNRKVDNEYLFIYYVLFDYLYEFVAFNSNVLHFILSPEKMFFILKLMFQV